MRHRLNQPKYLFLFLIALSAFVCVGAALALGLAVDVSLLEADEKEYYDLAGELIQGKYEFNLRRPPIHVLMLALLRLVSFDNLVATQVLVSAIFSLTGPLMYVLVRRITGNNLLAIAVALLTIFWPPFVYYGSTLYSETTALPLFVAFLILLPRGSVLAAQRDDGWRRCLLAGCLMGLCMLLRPMYLLFGSIAVVILFLEERRWLVALRRAIILTIGCCLVVLPWSVYISAQAGKPVLVSANGGETLGGGLNPVLIEQGYKVFIAPNGRQTWVGPGKWLAEHENGYLNQEELRLPYDQRDRLLRQRTIEWALAHPGSALYLQTAKLLYMWGIYPFWNGVKQTLFGNLPTVSLIALSILSLLRFRRYWRHLARFWILPVFVSLVALISWGSWRFRQPGDLGLIMLGGLFLCSLFVRPSSLILPKSSQQKAEKILVATQES